MKSFQIPETLKHVIALNGLALYPFFQFIYFQNISLLSTEVLCLSLILIVMTVVAYVILKQRRYPLCALYAILITSIVSANMANRNVSDFVMAGLLLIAVFIVLARFTLSKITNLVLIFFVGMIVSDLFIHRPHPGLFSETIKTQPDATLIEKKPSHILYILTDEFIGLDGMPAILPESGPMRQKLLDFYLAKGFTIFPKAYSNYADTVNSLSNILNFTAVDQSEYYYAANENDKTGFHLTENKFFDWAKSQGLRTNVYQTNKLDFCSHSQAVGQCVEYSKRVAQAVEGNDLTLLDKMWVLGSQFIASHVLISEIATPLIHRNILQPYIGPLKVAPQTLARLKQDILNSHQDTLFYTYLSMPLFPYVYDCDCHVRPVKEWQHRMKLSGADQQNTEESYALKYERYYEQIDCLNHWLAELFAALQDAGLYDSMTIIIHGDHGSRINMFYDPRASVQTKISPQDMLTSFSTFLAIKKPSQKMGRERLPQGSLKNIIKTEVVEGKIFEGEDESFVYFKPGLGKKTLIKVPMVKMNTIQ